MTKNRSRMTNTLTSGCSQAAERPRPGGGGFPHTLVQVKLSNSELMASLGISYKKKHQTNHKTKQKTKQVNSKKKIGVDRIVLLSYNTIFCLVVFLSKT